MVSVVPFHHSVFAQSWKKQNLVREVLEGPYQETLCSHWAVFSADSLGMFVNPKFSCSINPPPTQRDTNKHTNKQTKTKPLNLKTANLERTQNGEIGKIN